MTDKQAAAWVLKNCKFAAVPLPGMPEGASAMDRVARKIASELIQFINMNKGTAVPLDINTQVRQRVDAAVAAMPEARNDPNVGRHLSEVVFDILEAQGHSADPIKRPGFAAPGQNPSTPFQGARNAPTSPPPTKLPL